MQRYIDELHLLHAIRLAVLATDLWSAWLSDAKALHVVRFLHGIAGGASTAARPSA